MLLDWVLAIVAALALVGAVLSLDADSQKAPAPPVDILWDAL
jgi:hypothetical protein